MVAALIVAFLADADCACSADVDLLPELDDATTDRANTYLLAKRAGIKRLATAARSQQMRLAASKVMLQGDQGPVLQGQHGVSKRHDCAGCNNVTHADTTAARAARTTLACS